MMMMMMIFNNITTERHDRISSPPASYSEVPVSELGSMTGCSDWDFLWVSWDRPDECSMEKSLFLNSSTHFFISFISSIPLSRYLSFALSN
jgi:hypothetical protein